MNQYPGKRMLPALLLCTLVAARAGEPPSVDGAVLYQRHCTACHGRYGQGDGPMAPDLEVALKDLRDLAARNDGTFPETYVRRIVDGRDMRALHGPAGMPVWGEIFSAEATSTEDAATLARARLDAIISFLRTVQRSPESGVGVNKE